jgi:hypothetical protein
MYLRLTLWRIQLASANASITRTALHPPGKVLAEFPFHVRSACSTARHESIVNLTGCGYWTKDQHRRARPCHQASQ